MVCTPGRGKMAAVARLLVSGHLPEATAEEVHNETLASQSIHREFHEADEANLLEEEDMHVFDCRPLSDPLNLVCCNACKKPVKASQFAAHAERCRTLNFTEDGLELDGGTGHKKPPRKGRKKLQIANENQSLLVGEQERIELVDGEEIAAESNLDVQAGLASSLPREAKRGLSYIEEALVTDGSGVSHGSINRLMAIMSPSEKRTRLIAAETLPVADCLEKICDVTTELGTGCSAITCFPVPLATKMYHTQRNHLRTVLGHLYHEALAQLNGNDSMSPRLVSGNTALSSQVSLSDIAQQNAQTDDMLQKKSTHAFHVLQKPDQIPAQSSDLCLGTAGVYPSTFTTQLRDNKITRPVISVDTAPAGIMRSRYHSTAYSFPGNSGTTLGTVQ